MNYRLTKKELRIMAQTKREEQREGIKNDAGGGADRVSMARKIMPYVYFVLTFLIIAITIRLFVYYTT